uniref:G-protein coupled receptors family 1 profile domain-containing protein n=1 Tax=Plectus sambesii TaxID=2011161 RepID=A0A914W248_9BILA
MKRNALFALCCACLLWSAESLTKCVRAKGKLECSTDPRKAGGVRVLLMDRDDFRSTPLSTCAHYWSRQRPRLPVFVVNSSAAGPPRSTSSLVLRASPSSRPPWSAVYGHALCAVGTVIYCRFERFIATDPSPFAHSVAVVFLGTGGEKCGAVTMRLLPPPFEAYHVNASAASCSMASCVRAVVDTKSSSSSVSYLKYALVVGVGCAILLTVVANLLTIFILVRHRPLQKSISNLYILSLSVADLFIGVFVMTFMAAQTFAFRSYWPFGSFLCDLWQLGDFVLSTTSLYSICAIGLDRWWNLEKPLRVFKRSRRIAKRLILGIWLTPLAIWLPVYLATNSSTGYRPNGRCYFDWTPRFLVLLVAVPFLYMPALILIGMFCRISLVVRRHLRFLRAHSNNPGSSNSIGSRSRETTPLRTPEPPRRRADSISSNTSGYCTGKSPRCQSPRFPKVEWQLAPLSEEKSSGRERSQSEQINVHTVVGNHLRIHAVQSVPARKVSIRRRLFAQQPDISATGRDTLGAFAGRLNEPQHQHQYQQPQHQHQYQQPQHQHQYQQPQHKSPSRSVSAVETSTSRLKRISSSLSRTSSKRFSVIAIPSNLAELLQREGLSQQMRAAKAVAIILFCFLFCWLPFFVLWPVKVLCRSCVSDHMYVLAIWLNYFCSMINPVLYTLSSPRVRGALRSYWPTGSTVRRKQSMYRSVTIV